MDGRQSARPIVGYFEGGFTAGPLLLPGRPLTLDGSCWLTAGFCPLVVVLEPAVPLFAGGPFLFPGAPWMPAPEFCALGAELLGGDVCADAATADMAKPATTKITADFIVRPPRVLLWLSNVAARGAFLCPSN